VSLAVSGQPEPQGSRPRHSPCLLRLPPQISPAADMLPSSSAARGRGLGRPLLLCLAIALASLLAPASASESDHKYKAEEPVKLWVNKVGPYNNPQETYNYYSLPFCQPSENPIHKWGGLGEVLGGNELIDSQLEMKFLSMLLLLSLHPCLRLLFTYLVQSPSIIILCPFPLGVPFLCV